MKFLHYFSMILFFYVIFLLFTFFVFFAVNYHTLLCNFGNPLYFISPKVVKEISCYHSKDLERKPGKLEAISTKTAVNFPKSIILQTATFLLYINIDFHQTLARFYFHGSLILSKMFCFIV